VFGASDVADATGKLGQQVRAVGAVHDALEWALTLRGSQHFVACTRAREALRVTWSGPASPFLPAGAAPAGHR